MGDDFMSTEPQQALPHPRRSRIWATIKALLRARVTAGLIVVLPIWITYVLVRFIFEVMRDASLWVVHAVVPDERLNSAVHWFLLQTVPDSWHVWMGLGDPAQIPKLVEKATGWGIAIFSVLLTVFLLYFIGLLTTNIFGRRTLAFFEHLLDRLPLVKTVYRGCKQILATFGGDQTQKFQRVGLIPFPNSLMRCPAFIMNSFHDLKSGEEWFTVFYFSTPSPTTGFVTMVRKSDVIEVDWSVEEAIRYVVSGGILVPEGPPFQARLNPPTGDSRS